MKTDLCKHGNPEPCTLCAHEDAEHDAAMASLYGGKSLEDMARWHDDARQYLTAAAAGSMSRNNSEALAAELLESMPAIQEAAALVRAQALDEAAAVCQAFPMNTGDFEFMDGCTACRDAILALKDRP